MNNITPNKWIVFVQWAIGLQWLKLVTGLFSSPVFIGSLSSVTQDIADTISGYSEFIPASAVDHPDALVAAAVYGGIATGVVLLAGGVTVLWHKPVTLGAITVLMVTLCIGAVMSLVLHTALYGVGIRAYEVMFMMGMLHSIVLMYYLFFRRYKKRNRGTNLQYGDLRGIH